MYGVSFLYSFLKIIKNMNTIRVNRQVTSDFELLRKPTNEELLMIANNEMFDIEGLIDWDKEDVIEEDYSDCKEIVTYDNKKLYERR